MKNLLCLFLLCSYTFAQNAGTIKGVVIDEMTGDPLIGANVIIVDTKRGAATDADGEFIIQNIIPNNYDVIASYIGYEATTLLNVSVIADSVTNVVFELPNEPLFGKQYETGSQVPDYNDYLMVDWDYPISRLYNTITYKLNSVTLWADFNFITDDGFIPIFVINDTEAQISIPTQNSDIYLKQQFLDDELNWRRSQSHMFSFCGNSYMHKFISPKSFMIFKAVYPKEGEKRTIRYKIYSKEISFYKKDLSIKAPLILESNSGVGFVIEEEVEKSKYDRLEYGFKDLNYYYNVFNNEIDFPEEKRGELISSGLSMLAKQVHYDFFLDFAERFADDSDGKIRVRIVGLLGEYGNYSDDKTIELLEELSDDSEKIISDYAKKQIRILKYKEKRKQKNNF